MAGKCSTIHHKVPDLSPQDYNLFPKLEELFQEIRFSYLSELSSAVTGEILMAQQKYALTRNRKAAGTLVSVHFARAGLH